ncbi:MAG TPA: recombinase family protein [Abditibacteriaceae bacterium]|jgi:DNA invertase Pin-like site-specific DNA recombinase
MRYIQYARRSSDENSHKQLQSIQGQESDLVRLVNDLSLNVVEKLEESRTAKAPGRPVFNYMIGQIKRKKADAILCWHIDRLSRNELDSGTVRWLLRQGVIKEIRTPHKVYLPDDSAFITAIESAQSEQYSIDLRVRVVRGMKQKCGKGEVPFRVPQGYLNDRLNRTTHVDPERFPLIQKAFKVVAEGTKSVADVHRLLHEEWGFQKKAYGNSPTHILSLNALHNLLSNTFYVGYFTWQGQVYHHGLPKAVSSADFEKVQKILKSRSRWKSSRTSRWKKDKRRRLNQARETEESAIEGNSVEQKPHQFPYRGLILCATCGFPVTAEMSKGHIYYHCNNRLKTCTKKGVRQEEVERHLSLLLDQISVPPEFQQLALESAREEQAKEEQQRQDIRQALVKAVADLKRQKDALLGLYLQGHLSEDEYAGKKKELTEQETQLASQQEPEIDSEENKKAIEQAIYLATHGKRLFLSGDAEIRRFLALQVADELMLNNGHFSVRLNPLFACRVRDNSLFAGLFSPPQDSRFDTFSKHPKIEGGSVEPHFISSES